MDFSQEFSNGSSHLLEIFKEPRGIMRVLQFIFALVGFYAITGFEGYVNIPYCYPEKVAKIIYDYPFNLEAVQYPVTCNNKTIILHLFEDYSFDAEFYVVTCVLSIIFCVIISIVYIKFSEMYENNDKISLADFVITVLLGVFWLSSTAIWTLGLHSLKSNTKGDTLSKTTDYCITTDINNFVHCTKITSGGYFGLNMSVIIGFLNFFLWASDLWFLYKETPWFQTRQSLGTPS
uniref:MARVEL domain-containing protein n=1 Tax=Clastoptera arizonana TaxID=38151 RepID=A0A1B6BZJ6_9HEMI